MVVKATNNQSTASGAGQPKAAGRRTTKKRWHVTEARAKAQRARLDTQAEARHVQMEQEVASPHQTPNRKTDRQEVQAKRRVITTLIEAYIQDHIGGNASKKTVERHRTALGLMQLFLHEKEELAEWGSAGEDHLFLSETRQPLTKNGMEMLFKRLKARAGIVGKRISPHIFRHTFAMNYLIKSNDPFSLQELLGHEDLTTVLNYIQKYSEGGSIANFLKRKITVTFLLCSIMSIFIAMNASGWVFLVGSEGFQYHIWDSIVSLVKTTSVCVLLILVIWLPWSKLHFSQSEAKVEDTVSQPEDTVDR